SSAGVLDEHRPRGGAHDGHLCGAQEAPWREGWPAGHPDPGARSERAGHRIQGPRRRLSKPGPARGRDSVPCLQGLVRPLPIGRGGRQGPRLHPYPEGGGMRAFRPYTAPAVLASSRATTQSQLILSHLQEGKSITPQDAQQLFGCMRLAARIADLRKLGHAILTETEDNGTSRYAR